VWVRGLARRGFYVSVTAVDVKAAAHAEAAIAPYLTDAKITII
jgi:hypothetical protein